MEEVSANYVNIIYAIVNKYFVSIAETCGPSLFILMKKMKTKMMMMAITKTTWHMTKACMALARLWATSMMRTALTKVKRRTQLWNPERVPELPPPRIVLLLVAYLCWT